MNFRTRGTLRVVELFRDLDSEELADVEQRCIWATYSPGQVIVTEGDRSNDVYFIVNGEARVLILSPDGKEVTFRDIGPGKILGEFSAIDNEPRSATVEAVAPCRVARMTAENFRDVLITHPTLAMRLLESVISEVRSLTNRVYEFTTFAVKKRIHAELLRLGRTCDCGNGTALLEPAPKMADIASRISTHREAVSREITELTRMGLVERVGRKIRICDIDGLAMLVAEAPSAELS